jgi:hypothetical protein
VKSELKSAMETRAKSAVKSDVESEVKRAVKSEVKIKVKSEVKSELSSEVKTHDQVTPSEPKRSDTPTCTPSPRSSYPPPGVFVEYS